MRLKAAFRTDQDDEEELCMILFGHGLLMSSQNGPTGFLEFKTRVLIPLMDDNRLNEAGVLKDSMSRALVDTARLDTVFSSDVEDDAEMVGLRRW